MGLVSSWESRKWKAPWSAHPQRIFFSIIRFEVGGIYFWQLVRTRVSQIWISCTQTARLPDPETHWSEKVGNFWLERYQLVFQPFSFSDPTHKNYVETYLKIFEIRLLFEHIIIRESWSQQSLHRCATDANVMIELVRTMSQHHVVLQCCPLVFILHLYFNFHRVFMLPFHQYSNVH